MRRYALPLCLAIAAVGWGGCEPTELIGKADECMRTGHPDQALEHYRQALVDEPDLAEDKKFMSKLNRARSRSAYREGEALAAEGKWEQAIEKFSESLAIEPEFENAKGARARAARRAAKIRHDRALKLADEGKGAEAAAELKRAVELDGDSVDAAKALALATGSGKAYPGQAADLYDQAVGLQERKRWQRAAEALRTAVELEPNHVLARVALHRSNESIRSARQACGDGRKLLEASRLDEAVRALERALEIWPACPEAPEALAEAGTRRAKAEGLFAKAREHAGRSDWSAAAGACSDALDVFPAHPGAKELLDRVRARASAAHAEKGKAALAGGDLLGACLQLRRAVGYAPESASVRADLAEACRRQAMAAEKAGRWGGALLWHMEAIDSAATPEAVSGVARSTRKISERVRFSLDVTVTDASGKASAASDALRKELVAALKAESPDFVTVGAAPATKPADYAAAVKLLNIGVSRKLVKTEKKRHAFTIRREVPNPDIPHLADQLRGRQLELDLLKRQFNRPCLRCAGTGRRVCRFCRGRGAVRCVNCGGVGKLRCGQCGGTGTKSDGSACRRCRGSGRARCLRCGGDGRRPCQVCSRMGQRRGWTVCSRCDGTGRGTTAGPWDIRGKEKQVADLERRIAQAPAKVVRRIPAQWAYTQRQFEKSGRVGADLRVASTDGSIRTERVRKTYAARDATIEGANPAIGLAEDPLELPDDAAVRTSLLRAAAGQIALQVVPAIVADRIDRTRRRAEQLHRRGKTLEAAEARMDLIHLLKPIRANEAAGLLAEVRTEHLGGESD